MNMLDWAKKEIEIRNKMFPDDKYGAMCCDSALKAFESLCNDGHSGYSISVTMSVLNALVEGRTLTPIEDTEDVWEYVREDMSAFPDRCKTYQCKRMSSLFKEVKSGGTISYRDVNRVYYKDMNHEETTWHSGWAERLVDSFSPITMPYMPRKPYEVQAYTYGKEVGTYDIYYIAGIKTPSGKWFDVDRYYKETEHGDLEISKEEFDELKKEREN